MALYRQLQLSFWGDAFVMDLTPEEKFFYVYLLQCTNTKQCGIFELPKRTIEYETGYNRETVSKLLERFITYDKIEYCEETKEIMILNWIKYNFINSRNTIKCINKEIKEIKLITHIEFESLKDWSQDMSYDSIILAIKEAAYHNARSMKYIDSILNNWHSLGLTTGSEVLAYQRE